MKPDETKLLNAYLDDELDAAASLDFEARMAGNPALRTACDGLREMSAAIRENADSHRAPAGLSSRVRAALPAAPAAPARGNWQQWWKPGAALCAVALAGFGLALALIHPAADETVARDVIASHVRATLSQRVIDVASSDQHTVKPWLSARLPFSPPVANFSAQGFELVGARVDYVDSRPAAVLVYKRRQHLVEVFVWPVANGAARRALGRDGFNVEQFAAEGMGFWVVSDLNRNELADFTGLLAARR